MIAFGGIAPLGAVHRRLRQLGFDLQNGFRLSGSGFGLVAEQFEHLLNVRDVALTRLHRLGIALQVVIAIRQPQPALIDIGDHLRGIVQIGRRPESKQSAHALRMQIRNRADQILPRLDRSDPLHLRLDRLRAQRVDVGLVHAGGIVVANLLHHRVAFGTGHRGLFEDGMQDVVVALLQFIEASPARLVSGDGILRHPSAACVLVKVDTRIGPEIHRCLIEARNAGSHRRSRSFIRTGSALRKRERSQQ